MPIFQSETAVNLEHKSPTPECQSVIGAPWQTARSTTTASGRPVVLRENMFGGSLGGKCSKDIHFFDEDAPLFHAVSKLCALRRKWIALRRGRQYAHEISGDGEHFGPPVKFGDRLHTLVSWSRVVAEHEMLVVFNTDEINPHELYSTLNPNLRIEGEELRLCSRIHQNRASSP
jgi:hypothetical protein